jgi:hypothetical protein
MAETIPVNEYYKKEIGIPSKLVRMIAITVKKKNNTLQIQGKMYFLDS